MGKNLVAAAFVFCLAAGCEARDVTSGIPSSVPKSGATVVGEPLAIAPRALVFLQVASHAPRQPPSLWRVATRVGARWRALGYTWGSPMIADDWGTGRGPSFGSFQDGGPAFQPEAGDVIAMLFDTRGLQPGQRLRFEADGTTFELRMRPRSFPLLLPSGMAPVQCRRRSDRFLPGTELLRVDTDAPAVWQVAINRCGDQPSGTYAVRTPSDLSAGVVSYFQSDLLL